MPIMGVALSAGGVRVSVVGRQRFFEWGIQLEVTLIHVQATVAKTPQISITVRNHEQRATFTEHGVKFVVALFAETPVTNGEYLINQHDGFV
jgi:hypothetical protein